MITTNTRFLGVDSTKVDLTKKKDAVNNAVGTYYTADEISGGGGGLEGTQYVFVTANGTDVENAAELQAAYVTAQGMNPINGKRITVIAAPANYNFATAFVMNTQFIDLVSLDGNRSVVFNGAGTISITANNIFVKGVDVLTKNFTIATNSNALIKIENCKGGALSFGGSDTINNLDLAGTFIDCEGGAFSFGANGAASGTFTDCIGGNDSFASAGIASGTFTNCVGGNSAFGAFGVASGTFTNCIGGSQSFASAGIASGTFTNCVGENSAFAANGTASGTFTDCRSGDSSFASVGVASGTFTNCTSGLFSFATADTASGTFTNCKGGDSSFGSFAQASGIFTNCIGGADSFGSFGTLSGKLYYCRLTSGGFETVTGAGITRLCIDGNNVENNQG